MRNPLSFEGQISPLRFALTAPLLLALQNVAVALCYRWNGVQLDADPWFWLLPLRVLGQMPGLASGQAAVVFAFAFVVAWGLAVLSFRRASWSGRGHWLSAFAIFPVIQIGAIAALAVLPRRRGEASAVGEAGIDPGGIDPADIVQGVLAGVAIIVAAVLLSALTLGAYGWGLFVATPFIVGVTTGYIVNRRTPIGGWRTTTHVMAAGALGGLALLMFALEGFACIVLIAPLGLGAAALGGMVGRAIALFGHHRGHRGGRPLMSIAILPALFALEAGMPPATAITTVQHVDIAASPDAVWRTIVSDAPIGLPPGLTGAAGMAFPVRGRLLGEGVGATRLGTFSTGVATERVTAWEPAHVLAFTVLSQPPAMEEMSPYRTVHAPHLKGYVVTGDTRYVLAPLRGGGTRLTLEATTILHLEPIAYWAPIARWAFDANVRRVLESARLQSERRARP